MKITHFMSGILALALAASGCMESVPAGKADFTAQLTGSEQVPAITTAASGSATFWVNPDGTAIRYQLTVAGLTNVTMAHLHLGASGQNGPPVAWLYPATPTPKTIDGVSNGVLSEGSITAANLAGPLAGKTVGDLLAAIRANNIYVNVHTTDHSDGEIRGQVR
jgi:hypothetical protein